MKNKKEETLITNSSKIKSKFIQRYLLQCGNSKIENQSAFDGTLTMYRLENLFNKTNEEVKKLKKRKINENNKMNICSFQEKLQTTKKSSIYRKDKNENYLNKQLFNNNSALLKMLLKNMSKQSLTINRNHHHSKHYTNQPKYQNNFINKTHNKIPSENIVTNLLNNSMSRAVMEDLLLKNNNQSMHTKPAQQKKILRQRNHVITSRSLQLKQIATNLVVNNYKRQFSLFVIKKFPIKEHLQQTLPKHSKINIKEEDCHHSSHSYDKYRLKTRIKLNTSVKIQERRTERIPKRQTNQKTFKKDIKQSPINEHSMISPWITIQNKTTPGDPLFYPQTIS